MTRKRIISRRPKQSIKPKPPARHNWIWVLGGGLLIAAIGVAVLQWWQQPSTIPPTPPESRLATAKSPWPSDLSEERQLHLLMEAEFQLGQDLIKTLPGSEDPYVVLGNIYSRRGDTDRAQQMWQQALAINPMRPDIYNSLAGLAKGTDQLESAVQLWQKALEIDPRRPGIHLKIAETQLEAGQFQSCIEHANTEMLLTGPAAEPCYQIGRAYQSLKDYTKARDSFIRSTTLDPQHVNAHYGLFTAYMRLGQTEAAQSALQTYQILKARRDATPTDSEKSNLDCGFVGLAQFYMDLHWIHQRRQRPAGTQVIMNKALHLGLDNAAFLKRMAAFFAKQQQPVQALELSQRLAKLEPNYIDWPLNIGTLAQQLKRYDLAEKAFRQAIQVGPDQDKGYRLLARLFLITQRNLPEACHLARKAVDMNPDAQTYLELGLTYLAAGDRSAGLKALERAVELAPGNAIIRKTYEDARKEQVTP